MDIIEQYIKGKQKEESLCEDCLVVTSGFAAVIDGVTSKTDLRYRGMATGRLAVWCLEQTVRSWREDISLEEAIASMTAAICKVYKELGTLESARTDISKRLSASVILYSAYHRQVWSIGDCQCMVNGVWHTYPKLIDKIIEEARALYAAAELEHGKTAADLLEHDTSREFVLPLIQKAAGFQNSQADSSYAYGVIDGFPVNRASVHVESVPDEGVVVLASDGYPKLFDTLAKSEEYLEFILQTDPLCCQEYRSTKGVVRGNCSYDDRAYLRFRT